MSESGYREFQFRIGHERVTWAVQLLILSNVIVFTTQLLVDIAVGNEIHVLGGEIVGNWFAFSPEKFEQGKLWTPFTYLFLHAGLSHLFFNMLMLYFFGPDVERVLGTRQFLVFYLGCGVLGVLANYVPIALGANGNIAVLGASGATLGVLVAFAILEPDRQIFLFPLPIPLNARALVIILVVLNLMTAVSGGGSTSVSTHFGGMAVGFLYMKGRPLLAKSRLKRRVRRRGPSKRDLDKLGEEVDNILNFHDRDRR